jgi:hypothetical protein
MGLYQSIGYLKFLWGSSNQHGVHSPFMYNYLTKCLYAPRNKTLDRSEDVLVKSIHYFDYKHIALFPDDPHLRQRLTRLCKAPLIGGFPFDVIYVRAAESTFKKIDAHQIHNGTMLMVTGIYKNREAANNWKALRQMDQAQVTVDLCHCGLIFFRREQARQHFKLRI